MRYSSGMRSSLLTLAIGGLLATLQGCSPSGPGAAGRSQSVNVPDVVDFNWHVRQILSNNCFQCHGPDAAARQAGLRLDDPVVAMAELAGVAGPPRHCAGRAATQHADRTDSPRRPEQRMPPIESRRASPMRRWRFWRPGSSKERSTSRIGRCLRLGQASPKKHPSTTLRATRSIAMCSPGSMRRARTLPRG